MILSKTTVTLNSVTALVAAIESCYTKLWNVNSTTIRYINDEIWNIVCSYITDDSNTSSERIDGYNLSYIDKRYIKINLSMSSDMIIKCIVTNVWYKPERMTKKFEFLLDVSNIPVGHII